MQEAVHYSPHTLPPMEDVDGRRRRVWTTVEERRLAELYPLGGLVPCLAAFPDRTPSSIYRRAWELGLTAPANRAHGKRRPTPYQWTEQQDQAIRRAYAEGCGAVKRLCVAFGRPHGSVRYRATKIGVATPRLRPERWSPAEDEVLRASAHLSLKRLQLVLRRAGFERTMPAIAWRRAELGIDRAERAAAAEDRGLYTASQVAGLFGVSSKTVSVWIEKGLIFAKRRDKVTWTIKPKAIREFVVNHAAHVDLRKVEAGGDKFLLLDLLFEKKAGP